MPTYIITGPTSGIGLKAALDLAQHGTVVLVGRNKTSLESVKQKIESKGGKAKTVVCDLQEPDSIVKAGEQIKAMNVTFDGLINNAGCMQVKPTKNSLGWDTSFATNTIGPYLLTIVVRDSIKRNGNIVFTTSAVEDPERSFSVMAGFKGSRFISIEATSKGEFAKPGAKMAGQDSYATTKQCQMVNTFALAREDLDHKYINVEPGYIPGTGLGRQANVVVRGLEYSLGSLVAKFVTLMSNTSTAGKLLSKTVRNQKLESGSYIDQDGKPMQASKEARNKNFQDNVLKQTREFLASKGMELSS